MQFTSLAFLFGFFPIVLGLYQLLLRQSVSGRIKNGFLVFASLLFYAFGSLKSLFVLVFVLLWNWTCAAWIAAQLESDAKENEAGQDENLVWPSMEGQNEGAARLSLHPETSRAALAFKNAKEMLILCVAINLLVLFLYKYMDSWLGGLFELFHAQSLLPTLVMPVGLSFYMFSCLSYVFDIYQQKANPCSLMDFALYAAFFGRVNMGPVGHFARFANQLHHHPATPGKRKYGTALLIQGLAYKVLLADNFGFVFQALQANTTWLGNLLCGFAYFFQLYFDFAGYSRMARGICLWFGFELPPNFNKPYQAKSVQEFWRRWHISLTDWFRQYVYIPLGGNRVSARRWTFNLLAVWIVTGLWHGAAMPFLFWGFWQALLILLEKQWLKAWLGRVPAFFGHLWVIVTQLLGWTLFFSGSLMDALLRIGRYFGANAAAFANSEALFWLLQSLVLFGLGILCCSDFFEASSVVFQKVRLKKSVLGAAGYGLVFLMALALLIARTSQTFLYAAF